MQHPQDGNANPCEAEGKQPRSEAELLASLDVDAAPSPPSPPPSTSLTTPPPRSLTMTPRVHYVAAPLLSALRRKEVMQPPTVANAAGTVTIDLYSSSTAPSSSLPDTLRASTEVNSLEVEMPSRSSVHEETSRRATGGSGRAPAATTAIVPSPHHQQQQQQELRNVPHAPPAAVTAQRRKAPVPSPGSSQRRAVRPSRPRGHTGAVARHRRPDDGSTMSCDVPHLSPSSGSVAVTAVTDGARTSASTFALTYGDSLVTEDTPGGEGTARADTQTTTPTATAVLNSAEVRSTTEAFPSPSPPSSFSAPSHGAVRLRRAPSPPLLPAWVYALSEHVGPRVPSPPAPREHAGGEVATLHTEAAERSAGAVRAARRSVLITNLATPLRLRTASSPSSPVTSTGVMEWRSSTAASSRSSAPQPSWHADVDRHHAADVHAGVVPVTWLMGGFGGSLHNTPTHAQRRSLTSVNTAATAALIEEGGAEDASGHPSLPVFFTAPRVAEGTQQQQQQQQQQQSFSSPASDWRLERAVQAGSSAEDTLAEEERSRASLYAADEMAKPGSFQSFPPA